MKLKNYFINLSLKMLLMASMLALTLDVSAQCNQNFMYGLTNVGMIQRINIANGIVNSPINPAYGGNAASYSNAMGYNLLNGKYYYFKRNSYVAPQEFVSFDPATNLYAALASSPAGAGNIINLGCVSKDGLGYYCLDAVGTLYYYNVGLNTWTTICANIRDQFNRTLASIIDPLGVQRYYGDIAIDGSGALWLLVSGAVDYGLYKINGPLPTVPVANLTATQIISPTTASPAGSFGGMAFNATGDMYLSSNSPNNKLFKLQNLSSLIFVANLSVSGVGNDLTSCNYPLEVLASEKISFSARVVNQDVAVLQWSTTEFPYGSSYSIEHSNDGIAWDEIYKGAGIINDATATSSFSHKNLSSGTHYYRLRKTDPNGMTTYSALEKATINSLVKISIWPNPAQNELKVQDMDAGGGMSSVLIYDYTGRLITQSLLNPGVNTIAIQSLRAGTYVVRLKHSNRETINSSFIKL
jgi:hypothetical protein